MDSRPGKATLAGALMGMGVVLACTPGPEAHESPVSEFTGPGQQEFQAPVELPSQDEVDREAAARINDSNADEEYRKLEAEINRLVEEINRGG